jgi:hypothetical protein
VSTLRARLTLGYLAVIVLGMAVAAPLAWLAVEQSYLDMQKANLLAQAALVARAVAPGCRCPPEHPCPTPDRQCGARHAHARARHAGRG